MGHFCRICGRKRPNERFSGKGHRSHVCKDCARLPKAERERIEQLDEMEGFLRQHSISQRNIERLEALTESPDADVAELARLVLDVARLRPFKKRRWKYLAENHPGIYLELEERGLLPYYRRSDDDLWT